MKKYYEAFLHMCREMNYDFFGRFGENNPHLIEKIKRYEKLVRETEK